MNADGTETKTRKRIGMRKWVAIGVVSILLVLSSPIVLRKTTVPLVSCAQVVAVAKRPFVLPWADNEFGC